MERSEQIGELAAALAAAQAELPAAVKDAQNPHLKNRYADLAACWEAVRGVMPKHGLAVMQGGEETGEGYALYTILAHTSGQWVKGHVPLRVGEAKGLNDMQALGSAWTYARRYGLAAMVGLIAEDDDGSGAGHPREAAAPAKPSAVPISEKQRHLLGIKATEAGLIRDGDPSGLVALLASMGYAESRAIPMADFDRVLAAVRESDERIRSLNAPAEQDGAPF